MAPNRTTRTGLHETSKRCEKRGNHDHHDTKDHSGTHDGGARERVRTGVPDANQPDTDSASAGGSADPDGAVDVVGEHAVSGSGSSTPARTARPGLALDDPATLARAARLVRIALARRQQREPIAPE